LLPLLVNVEPFAKLLNLPKIGLADVLLITVNTVPAVSGLVPESAKVKFTLLPMVTPRALTLDALGVARFKTHL
jgi:hypothetical protein